MSKKRLYAIRRENLDALIQIHFSGNQASLATAIERAPAMVNQWLREYRNISEHSARWIEMCLSLPAGILDTHNPELSDEPINLNELKTLILRVNRDLKNIEAHLGKTEPTNLEALLTTLEARAAITKLRTLVEKPDEKNK